MDDLLLYFNDYVIIPRLNGWSPVNKDDAYKKLRDRPDWDLLLYYRDQNHYLEREFRERPEPNEFYIRKLLAGLEVITKVLMEKGRCILLTKCYKANSNHLCGTPEYLTCFIFRRCGKAPDPDYCLEIRRRLDYGD